MNEKCGIRMMGWSLMLFHVSHVDCTFLRQISSILSYGTNHVCAERLAEMTDSGSVDLGKSWVNFQEGRKLFSSNEFIKNMLWEASAWDSYQTKSEVPSWVYTRKNGWGLQSPTCLLLDQKKVPAASFRLEENLEKVELLSLSMKFKVCLKAVSFLCLSFTGQELLISPGALWSANVYSFAMKNKSLKIKKTLSLLLISIPQRFLSCQTLMLTRLMSIRLPVLLPVKLTVSHNSVP